MQENFPDPSARKDLSQKMGKALQSIKDAISDSLPVMLEKWPLDVFIVCTIVCFLCSTAMHLFWIKDLYVCYVIHNIDMSGISLAIFGSTFSIVYYIFKCDSVSYYIYFGLQVISLVSILVCINFKVFNSSRFENLKVYLFLLQGVVATISLVHWILMK